MKPYVEEQLAAALRELQPSETLETELLAALQGAPQEPARPRLRAFLPSLYGALTIAVVVVGYVATRGSGPGRAARHGPAEVGDLALGAAATVLLAADGGFRLVDSAGRPILEGAFGGVAEASEGYYLLHEALAAFDDTPDEPRHEGRVADAVAIRTAADARWTWVLRAVEAAVTPRRRFARAIVLQEGAEPFEYAFPADRGLQAFPDPDPSPAIRISLTRQDEESPGGGWTRVRLGNGREWRLDPPALAQPSDATRARDAERADVRRSVAEELRGARSRNPRLHVELGAPPLAGDDVPADDALLVLQACGEASVPALLVGATRLPQPQGPSRGK